MMFVVAEAFAGEELLATIVRERVGVTGGDSGALVVKVR